jgi:hypothetical protein
VRNSAQESLTPIPEFARLARILFVDVRILKAGPGVAVLLVYIHRQEVL